MSVALEIEPEAEEELAEAAKRYEASVPGLGIEFLAEMRQRLQDVAERPQKFQPFGGAPGVQCAHAVGRFPHLVIYLALVETLHVLAFMHPWRRPGYWLRRGPLK
jgi:hypothetical protein